MADSTTQEKPQEPESLHIVETPLTNAELDAVKQEARPGGTPAEQKSGGKEKPAASY